MPARHQLSLSLVHSQVGVHGHYRNPRAHSNRINREEDLNDFLDAIPLFSYIHKRLDTAGSESLTG
ncbi:TIGR02391 family protein [Arthrobacter sp. Z1-15]